MRSYDELVARCKVKRPILFDFGRDLLITYLEYDDARPYLAPDTDRAGWGDPPPMDRASTLTAIADYLPFAFEKAHDERGLSAIRSVQKLGAWVWLLGEEEAALLSFIEDDGNYEPYGLPILKEIAEHFGLPVA